MRDSLTISVDTSECESLLADLEMQLSGSAPWLRWLASEVLQHLDEPVEFLPIDSNLLSASSAGDLRIVAKPAHRLALLVAALRAGNGDSGVLVDFHIEHGASHG